MATRLRDLDVDLITRAHLEEGLERLRDEFVGIFSAETVERFMAESLQALGGARLKDFVPLFVHRFARERLRALGQVQGTIAKTVSEVLFVCVQNADADRWPPHCSTTTPTVACTCARPAAHRPKSSTPT